MRDLRPVLLVLGVLIATLGTAMWVPVLVDLGYDEDGWKGLVVAAAITLFCGISIFIGTWRTVDGLSVQQSFVLTTAAWVVLPAFGALPFTMVGPRLDFTDAYFEAMSGLTTTGSTVITGLDSLEHSLLLWRAMLQWLGGIGIVVMAVAILPFLRIGGLQLFRMESSDKSEKVMPRIGQIAMWIFFFYFGFTLACAFFYWLFGMPGFDAVCHAMSTVATGGFSTSDGSMGYFGSTAIEATAIAFALEGVEPQRPLTHDLLRITTEVLGAAVHRVVITQLQDGIYYADLVFGREGDDEVVVSSRPSDAIALAARVDAPLFVAPSVLDEAGVEIHDEDEEAEVERFRDFLDDITPEDFSSPA